MTVEQTKAAAVDAVRAFAEFYRANSALIDALPNAEEMHAVRTEVLALIRRVSDELEAVSRLTPAKQAEKAAQVAEDVRMLIETLRARRAELEHYLGKTGSNALLVVGAIAAVAAGLWFAKKRGMLGELGDGEDCGCG